MALAGVSSHNRKKTLNQPLSSHPRRSNLESFATTLSSSLPDMVMGGFVPLVALLLITFVLSLLRRRKTLNRLPPGPRGLPLIGNLHQLGHLPHRSLHLLSTRHGPVVHLRLGHVPTLVVSSPSAAMQVLKTHDLSFCSRPALTAWRKLSYGGHDIAFAPYGPHWRHARKLSTAELFTSKRVAAFRPIRAQEVATLVDTIAAAKTPVNLSDMFLCLLNNVTFREGFGRRVSDEGECGRSQMHDMIGETIALMGGFCAGDFYPSMPWLNVLTGVQRRLERNFKEMDEFLEREVEAARWRDDGSFASILVRHQDDPASEVGITLTKDHIKAILMDIFIAGTDTAAVSLVWCMTELMKNPRVMSKAQDEVRKMAAEKGSTAGAIDEGDLHHLKYLNAVIKETLRLHPPGPLLLPRESMEDCEVDGYHIPAKTRVYINAWAISRDPNHWRDPEVFRPERFNGGDGDGVDYKGQHFELVPFGGGRRICPGIALAAATMEFTLANLLYRFDWSPPEGMRGEEIDVEETFGIVVSKKVPLVLVANDMSLMMMES